MLKINLLYILITLLVLFLISKLFTVNSIKKCTDCNVWNHVDARAKCERLCKESNLTYSGKSKKIGGDLHCDCS